MRKQILYWWISIALTCFIEVKAQSYMIADKAPVAVVQRFSDGRELLYAAENEAAVKRGIDILQKMATQKPVLLDACIVLAEYYTHRDPALALAYYRTCTRLNAEYRKEAVWELAQLEYHQRYYDSALVHVARYLAFEKIDYRRRAELLSERLHFILEAKQHPVQYQLKNIGPEINTSSHEYDPFMVQRNGDRQLIITREQYLKSDSVKFRKGGRKNEDIVSYRFRDGHWLPEQSWSAINTPNNEGCASVSANGEWLAFTQCSAKDDPSDCDIFYSRWENSKWSSPIDFGPQINTASWESQPVFSENGEELYFVRDNMSQTDILHVRKEQDGTWGVPVRLEFCSGYNEHAPFLHPAGNTLYFVSDHHKGMGGDDVFVSRKEQDGRWSEPQNLGWPLNSERDELNFSTSQDGTIGYVASDRALGFGGMDIYYFELDTMIRPKVLHFRGKLQDATSGKGISGKVYIRALPNGTPSTILTDSTGHYSVVVPAGRKYEIHASSMRYFSADHLLSEDTLADFNLREFNFLLSSITNHQAIVLKEVHFVQSQATLLEGAERELEYLAKWLKEFPDMRILISGHTDNVGNPKDNKKLSEERAQKVKDWLIMEGIEETRLRAKGFGSDKPIAPNDTEENKKKNRRVEFCLE